MGTEAAVTPYTPSEMMATVAARELRDGEVVFVGIGLPNLACNLARATHAPRLVLIYESGAIGAQPERLPVSIGDPSLVTGSLMVCGMADVFQCFLQNGRIEVGFLGGAQVDRCGNINTTVIGRLRPAHRCDCRAAAARRRSRFMPGGRWSSPGSTARAFPEAVDFITSPGHRCRGSPARELGMPGAGPVNVITDKAILEADPKSGELVLQALYPGVRPDEVRAGVGWTLRTRDPARADAAERARAAAAARRARPETAVSQGMTRMTYRTLRLAVLSLATASTALAQQPAKPRARDLGVPFDGTPGALNAITDVPGVEVGQVTIVSGGGPLVVGTGPVRTGVTAILPRGRDIGQSGDGRLVHPERQRRDDGHHLDRGIRVPRRAGDDHQHPLGGRGARRRDRVAGAAPLRFRLVAADRRRDVGRQPQRHQRISRHQAARVCGARQRARRARGGRQRGRRDGHGARQFKGGIGTASRRFTIEDRTYTLGALVQCNYGLRRLLRIAGVPVGAEIADQPPCYDTSGTLPTRERYPRCAATPGPAGMEPDELGSIIVVVATDAPLLPHQLKRVATRVTLGVGRMGGLGGNSSGDIFVAFSTANPDAAASNGHPTVTFIPNEEINPVFEATVQATEESIVNALVAAETMKGADDLKVTALPHDRLRNVLRRYNRLTDQ